MTVMAYDCFVAICHPLHYMVITNLWLCILLVLVSWIMSVLDSLLESLMVLRLSLYAGLEIPHFICQLNQMVQLACSDTFLNNKAYILQLSCWLVVLLLISFTLTIRLFPAYVECHQLWGSIKHFLPVHLTSQLSPCFIAQT